MLETGPTMTARTAGRRWLAFAAFAIALSTIAVLALVAAPSEAIHAEIGAHPLTDRHTFTDDVALQVRIKPDGRPSDVTNLTDASNLAVVEITVEDGARFPWHTHPGPVLAAVTEGELVYVYADDCLERRYPAGTAFVDPGGDNVHTAFNDSGEDVVVIATFLDAPDEGELTLPVDEDRQAELNDRCLGSED